ncbi:hypothetical protein [Paraburkholderia sp. BL6665CI2N2]|uniref:hypothetical protein n=1 Tax=Paraburkholderia sp. BL6665CI2N2 TaxID=1938806 RepID=UPI001065C29E|nr:hypothetical protein [Paraburkholderia sp. BL6665CI2N2]
MVLQIAGIIDDPSRIATRRRRLEAMIWRKTAEVFLNGMTLSELAELITKLDCGLRTKALEHGSHREVVAFVERELTRGLLVICCVRAVGDAQTHAVLVIGVEGCQTSRQFDGRTLLILDPAEGPPTAMATCNARLHYAGRHSGELPRYAKYATASATYSVVLNGAVSVDFDGPTKPP